MSYGAKVARLVCQAGAGVGLVAALAMQQAGEGEVTIPSIFSVQAKSRGDVSQVNDLYQGLGIKWNSNWDMRCRDCNNVDIILVIPGSLQA